MQSKTLIILTICIALVFTPLSCSRRDDVSNQAIKDGYMIFKDDSGREVILPKTLKKVAVSGRISQGIVYTLSPDALVGIAEPWLESEKSIIKEKYLSLPLLGRIYGPESRVNLEDLIKISPDAVIDIGQLKPTSREDMDRFTETTGIPFIHLTMDESNIASIYRRVGALLGANSKAIEVENYINRTFTLRDETLKHCEKKDVLFLSGRTAKRVFVKDSYFSSSIDMCSNNIATTTVLDTRSYAPYYTEEEFFLYNPDVIIFSPLVDKEIVNTSPVLSNMDVIKRGAYYFFPHYPYENMGFPPGSSEVLGIIWLLDTLYPQYVTFDFNDELRTFYKIFFDVDTFGDII